MKLNKIFTLKNISSAFIAVAFVGCTDLDEKVMDEVLGEDGGNPQGAH